MASFIGTPAARGSSVVSFRFSRVTWAVVSSDELFSQRVVYTYYSINIFTKTKKILCNIFLWVILCSTRFQHAQYDCWVGSFTVRFSHWCNGRSLSWMRLTRERWCCAGF